MENLSDADANILQTFGPGQGIVSGQAVEFPLLVKVHFDADLVSDAIGDENFIKEAGDWKPNETRERNRDTVRRHMGSVEPASDDAGAQVSRRRRGRRPFGGSSKDGGVKPEGFED
jgi:hypothetical protein